MTSEAPPLDIKLFDLAWDMAKAIRGGGSLPHLTPQEAADKAVPYLLSRLEERNAAYAKPDAALSEEGR